MAKYREGLIRVHRKHGRWVLEGEVWRGHGDVAHIRIDLDRLWALLPKADKTKDHSSVRGPLRVRRPAWVRKRFC